MSLGDIAQSQITKCAYLISMLSDEGSVTKDTMMAVIVVVQNNKTAKYM